MIKIPIIQKTISEVDPETGLTVERVGNGPETPIPPAPFVFVCDDRYYIVCETQEEAAQAQDALAAAAPVR
ncbi:MAG: hypothetical protein HY884_00410 [Deltaproteobacteria bacterium]|nr:hypothetical protein [Deltaproteobacteria bacterium]